MVSWLQAVKYQFDDAGIAPMLSSLETLLYTASLPTLDLVVCSLFGR